MRGGRMAALLSVSALLLAACGSQSPAQTASRSTPTPTPSPRLPLTVPDSFDVTDTDTTTLTGSTLAGAVVTVVVNADSHETVAGADGKFTFQLTGLREGANPVTVLASLTGYADDTGSLTITETISPARKRALYTAGARTIPYPELTKDPTSLAGTKVVYTAQVFQFDSVTGLDHMIASVTDNGYGFWSDNVWLSLDDPSIGNNVFDKSIIRLWGQVVGPYTYTTTMNGQLTIPEIEVAYIDLIQK